MKQIRGTINLTFIVCFSLFSPLTFAATINVPADNPTIQAGIDAAENGDTVLVDDGIYKGEGNVNIDFKGKSITVKSRHGAETTIIDCEEKLETSGFTFQNSETNTSVLDGFTIKNGMYQEGSAIYLNAASPTIMNCVIDGTEGNWGAGITCFISEPIITDCTIMRNNLGISVRGDTVKFGFSYIGVPSRPTINNCIITENSGVGISCVLDSYATIKNSTISKNGKRGVYCLSFSGAVITNSHITENSDGGLKCYDYSRITVKNSIIDKNIADEGGGIYCSATSWLNATDCVIANNTATKDGGGIWDLTRFGDAFVKYCTITQNSAGDKGGGIYVADRGRLILTNSIVWDNTSDGTHPEIFPWGDLTIKSCNIKNGRKGIDPDGRQIWLSYEDNIDEDPLFVNANAGDFTLQPNSPVQGMGRRDEADQVEDDQEEAEQEVVEQEQNEQEGKEEDPLSVSHHGKRLVKWADLKRK